MEDKGRASLPLAQDPMVDGCNGGAPASKRLFTWTKPRFLQT